MTTTEEPETEKPEAAVPPRRRKILSWLLLAGGAAVFLSFAHDWPKERGVEFRFDMDVATVVRLDVTWTPADGGEPALGSSFRFEPGRAPKIVRTNVHLPDGSYALDITVERVDRSDSIQRSVTLGDSDQITVPLR